MSFDQDFVLMATLIKVSLPSQTLRISDGGFVVWGGEPDGSGGTTSQVYNSEHQDFGTLFTGEGLSDGEGDEAPAAAITFLANSNSAVGNLTDPSMQWSPVSIYQASINAQTGVVIAAIPLFFGFVDVPTLRDGTSGRLVDMTLVADTERFFMVNEGNRLSQGNHQSRYPGELGLNNMTGVEADVPWGTESRPRGAGVRTGSGYGGGSGGGSGGRSYGSGVGTSRY